jgi:hypothetical protein
MARLFDGEAFPARDEEPAAGAGILARKSLTLTLGTRSYQTHPSLSSHFDLAKQGQRVTLIIVVMIASADLVEICQQLVRDSGG